MGFPSLVEVMQSMFKVIKQLKLVVVNSDHASGGRQPDWTPRVVNGRTLPPLDTISIFVGGNILGRGLTVENLTTTWYTRTAAQPGEDTTVQRQRWFGYRGKLWEFVTVHIPEGLGEEMHQIHLSEEMERKSLYQHQLDDTSPAQSSARILPAGYRLGGKAPRVGPIAPRPLVGFRKVHYEVNDIDVARHNELVANRFLERLQDGPANAHAGMHNVNDTKPLTALEVADFLDDIRFSDHGSRTDEHTPDDVHARYAIYERMQQELPSNLLRAQRTGEPPARVASHNLDPYLVAAYLRFWTQLHDPNQVALQALEAEGLIHSEFLGPVPEPPLFNLAYDGGSVHDTPADSTTVQAAIAAFGATRPRQGQGWLNENRVGHNMYNTTWGGPAPTNRWIDQATGRNCNR